MARVPEIGRLQKEESSAHSFIFIFFLASVCIERVQFRISQWSNSRGSCSDHVLHGHVVRWGREKMVKRNNNSREKEKDAILPVPCLHLYHKLYGVAARFWGNLFNNVSEYF